MKNIFTGSKSIRFYLFSFLLAGTAPLSAQTIYPETQPVLTSRWTPNKGVNVIRSLDYYNQGLRVAFTGPFDLSIGGVVASGYCLEWGESHTMNATMYHTPEILEEASYTGVGNTMTYAAAADDIRRIISAYMATSQTKEDSAALQIAIWDVMGDNGLSTVNPMDNGSFKAKFDWLNWAHKGVTERVAAKATSFIQNRANYNPYQSITFFHNEDTQYRGQDFFVINPEGSESPWKERTTSVPEPSSAMLIVLGMVGCFLRRR